MTRAEFDEILDRIAKEESDAIFDRMNALMERDRPPIQDVIPEVTADTVRSSVRAVGRVLKETGFFP